MIVFDCIIRCLGKVCLDMRVNNMYHENGFNMLNAQCAGHLRDISKDHFHLQMCIFSGHLMKIKQDVVC